MLVLAVTVVLRRRRARRVLRLAPPQQVDETSGLTADAAEPPRLDMQFDILGATRSMMMFTLEYRLEIANRSDRALRDVGIAARITSPGRKGQLLPTQGAACESLAIERIGPQQSRSMTGSLRLPLAELVPLRQGYAPLLIPLVDITLDIAGVQGLRRVLVIGHPSPSGLGRIQPIRLDGDLGSIPGLQAQPVELPPVSEPEGTTALGAADAAR